MIGQALPCPTCGNLSIVPAEDQFTPALLGVSQVGPAATAEAATGEAITVAGNALRVQPVERPRAIVTEAEGFSFRRPQTTFDDMDLTPMVDVTFLLLIFFMVTASFSLQKTIEMPSPKSDQKGAAQSLTIEDLEENTVFVRIDGQNAIFIDDEPVPDPTTLRDRLTTARLATLRSELAIDARPEVFHETVVAVIDAATAAGMQRIRIVSRAGAD